MACWTGYGMMFDRTTPRLVYMGQPSWAASLLGALVVIRRWLFFCLFDDSHPVATTPVHQLMLFFIDNNTGRPLVYPELFTTDVYRRRVFL